MAILPRALSVLTLGLLAALSIGCSKSPEETAAPSVLVAPLIGTWAMTIQEPEDAPRTSSRTVTTDPDEMLRSAARGLYAADNVSVRITYEADRTGVIESSRAGQSKKQSFSWGLLSATSEQIKIDQETSDPPKLERVTYRIDSPDTMTIMDGTMQGSILTRVK